MFLLNACASATRPSTEARPKGTGEGAATKAATSAESAAKPAAAPEKKEKIEKSMRDEESGLGVAEIMPPAPRSPSTEAAPSGSRESGLKAGVADDNAQYNYFLAFLAEHEGAWPFRSVPAAGRIMIRVTDEKGAGVPNAAVTVRDSTGAAVDEATTYADGEVLYTNSEKSAASNWMIETRGATGRSGMTTAKLAFDPVGKRSVELTLQGERRILNPVPLDIVFVMDTTGSMGEEIARLKSTIDIIKDNLDSAKPRPALRFGLVLYKDRGDAYVVRSYPLTDDLEAFRTNLATAFADGGGDDPEDLEAALAETVDAKMGWNPDGVRLAFVVTDAPAQHYADGTDYAASVEKARKLGLKINTIGTGGLPLVGEYQLRQIAQRTRGRYIFLTYGERGESEGGSVGAVSHHTGSNWTADRLETVIIRFAKEELALMSGGAVSVPSDDWFEAAPVPDKDADAVLDELFGETLARLLDYSSAEVTRDTAAAVLPVTLRVPPSDDAVIAALQRNAERFGARLVQAAAASKRLKLVERDDLQAILEEIELNLSALGDENAAAKVGKLLGADVLIMPSLIALAPGTATGAGDASNGAAWELYLKLVRVSTAEILSVSRARIARGLGLK